MTLRSFTIQQFSETTMPAPTDIHNSSAALMDIQDTEANSLVLDFLFRNSFSDIASEFQKMPGIYEDLEILHSGLKLEHLVEDLFMKSIVYDFLRRTAHAKIAFEFKHLYGPFRELDGLTLEKLFDMYKKNFKVIVSKEPRAMLDKEAQASSCVKTSSNVLDMETQATNATPSTSQALIKSNKKVNSLVLGYSTYSSHTLINSKKEVNSLVFDYLVRLSHLEIAHDFIELVGPLEDVKEGPVLEEMFQIHKMCEWAKMHHITRRIEINTDLLEDSEIHEYHNYVQNFQPQPSEELELDDEFSDFSDENFEEISVSNVKYEPNRSHGVVEIEAITNGIHKIRSKKHHLTGIKIKTDLLGASHTCRFWLPIFKKNDWEMNKIKPIRKAYKEALKNYDKAKAGIRITWCIKRSKYAMKKYKDRPAHTEYSFGDWEKYTRGIGTKLLLKMGYEAGKGLGKELQGRSTIVEAHLRNGRGGIGAYGKEGNRPKAEQQPISASFQRSPKSSNFIQRNMSAAQRSPKSKSSMKQELQSLKNDRSVLKERLKNFMLEQEVMINNIDQKIDGIINILNDEDEEGEAEIGAY